MYHRLHYSIVCDEFKFMDIFGVRSNGYQVEFEIKVSKADLNRELKCIDADVESVEKYGKDWEKFIKHRGYLTGEYPKTEYDLRMEELGIFANTQNVFRPNEFYFYVPDFLAEYAAAKVAHLPYGVVKIGNYTLPNGRELFSTYTVVKKPEKLHTEKCTSGMYAQLAHALTIRGRLFQ